MFELAFIECSPSRSSEEEYKRIFGYGKKFIHDEEPKINKIIKEPISKFESLDRLEDIIRKIGEADAESILFQIERDRRKRHLDEAARHFNSANNTMKKIKELEGQLDIELAAMYLELREAGYNI